MSARTAKRQKPYHHGNLRESLVSTAVSVITTRGRPEFTLRELAKLLNVTHAAAYHHFRDKEGLLAAVAEEGYASLSLAMRNASATTDPHPLARMRAMGVAYIRFAIERPAHFRIMFSHKFSDLDTYPTMRDAGIETGNMITRQLEEGLRDGLYRDIDAQELLAVNWSTIHGLALLTINGHFDHLDPAGDTHNFVPRIMRHVLSGTASPKAQALVDAMNPPAAPRG